MNRGKTIIIQGGQYGSEGKGQIAAFVAGESGVWAAVRTGSINAGHTVYKDGKKFSMQIIPTAWIHPNIVLVLGAGCYIEPTILAKEVEMIREATGEDIRHRLYIDTRCAWFGEQEHAKSVAANRHHAMGATGKGCSEAIVSRMMDRGAANPQRRLFSQGHPDATNYQFIDTVAMLNHQLRGGHSVLLEGTQGALLDFYTGPYPFVTSRGTNAAAWLAEAGLPPVNIETVLVLRSHPIRVAGNSGPIPGEISWPELARSINTGLEARGQPPMIEESAIGAFEMALVNAVHKEWPEVVEEVGPAYACKFHLWNDEVRQRHRVCLSEANARALAALTPEDAARLKFFEMTTVTKKLRRIGAFNFEEARSAILMNEPTFIAYTFLNYDMPELWGEKNPMTIGLTSDKFLKDMEATLGVPIRYVTTERHQDNIIDFHKV